MLVRRIGHRLVGAAAALLLASLVAFTIVNAAPGDAAMTLIGESASTDELHELRSQMGLDQPFFSRYLNFLIHAMHGDLGESLISGRSVVSMIGERFTSTLVLACAAVLLASSLGILAGMLAAAHQGRLVDGGIMVLTTLGIAVPGFGFAMLLTLIFSLKLHLLPVAGGGTLAHIILPMLTLAAPMLAMTARLTRSNLLDVAHSEYVLAAHAKGVPYRLVWRKHILRNALVPVVTMVGLNFGHLLGGTFVVETIFGWPGLGRMLVQAVFDRDFPLILGAVLLLAVIFQVLNLIVDLSHGLLDPRVGSEAV
jgi:ABC-type dipeptide/oligopeptide/nickel transport system permease component